VPPKLSPAQILSGLRVVTAPRHSRHSRPRINADFPYMGGWIARDRDSFGNARRRLNRSRQFICYASRSHKDRRSRLDPAQRLSLFGRENAGRAQYGCPSACLDRLQPGQSVAAAGVASPVVNWSLISLQQRLVKTGGRLIQHARYYWLLPAESHLTRRLFAGVLRKIATLPSPAG
jgi:hypothetical protein